METGTMIKRTKIKTTGPGQKNLNFERNRRGDKNSYETNILLIEKGPKGI